MSGYLAGDGSGGIDRLRKIRRDDMTDSYQREMENFSGRRKRNLSSADERLTDDDDDEVESFAPEIKQPKTFAERMMQQMGYKEGHGLGRDGSGIKEPVNLSSQQGRIGLGHTSRKNLLIDPNERWDDTIEDKRVNEEIFWMDKCDDSTRQEIIDMVKDSDDWIDVRRKKMTIDDEDQFCDPEMLKGLLEAKTVFDVIEERTMRDARTRANPYEKIGSAIFQNRAAMKTANMDKIFDFMFSGENEESCKIKCPLDGSKGENKDREKEIFYFADVCAGPGGFSEYMLWRKAFYNAKGFGFTLKGDCDFKLDKFTASCSQLFEPFYGLKDNGDVMDPENIESLERFILKCTNGQGVNLMMADGGFSVEGQENLQEILSKRLYLCQLLVSLCIVKNGGNFFCKLFDIFTPFSIALIYLMRICYDRVCLHKPNTSRPACSERYIVCKGLKKVYSEPIKDYLKRVNVVMDQLSNRNDDHDVQELVPIEYLKDDKAFFDYIYEHNNRLADRQIIYLKKYHSYAINIGQRDPDQEQIQEDSQKHWLIPERPKTRIHNDINPHSIIGRYWKMCFGDRDLDEIPPKFSDDVWACDEKILKHKEYRLMRLAEGSPCLLVCTQNQVFLRKRGNWEPQDKCHLRLPSETILMVELAKSNSNDDVLRILDAAVLCGDNVSELPFDERIKAAKKFCLAIKSNQDELSIVVPVVHAQDPHDRRRGRQQRSQMQLREEKKFKQFKIIVAEVFTSEQLCLLRSETELRKTPSGDSKAFFKDSGYSFVCKGVRVIRTVKKEWGTGWSRSQNASYYFNVNTKQSIFGNDFKGHSTFWDTVSPLAKTNADDKAKLRSNPKQTHIMLAHWSWAPLTRGNYDPRSIIEDTENENGPTITSLQRMVDRTNASTK